MSGVRFRTIWLSDTHLGTRDCRAEALLEFIDTHDFDFLYLVGDTAPPTADSCSSCTATSSTR
jgi:hypothetical protein